VNSDANGMFKIKKGVGRLRCPPAIFFDQSFTKKDFRLSSYRTTTIQFQFSLNNLTTKPLSRRKANNRKNRMFAHNPTKRRKHLPRKKELSICFIATQPER
jgi:hypothetical protein